MEDQGKAWHTETISPLLEETAARLAGLGILKNFYLAGETALTLHLGHRRSTDLDFFSTQPLNEDVFLAGLQVLPGLSVVATANQTLHLHVGESKVSFLGYDYPLLFPLEDFRGIAVADVRDIACMKLSALAARGSRRDFIDLYTIALLYGLRPLFDFFHRKFARVNYSNMHLRKSLTYFADAEKEPMPEMLAAVTWSEVKAFFLQEAPALGPL